AAPAATQAAPSQLAGAPRAPVGEAAAAAAEAAAPVIPASVVQKHLQLVGAVGASERVVYHPAMLGVGRVHYVSATYDLDHWRDVAILVDARDELPKEPWADGELLAAVPACDNAPHAAAHYGPSPAALARAASYKSWASSLKNFLYRELPLSLHRCAALKQVSRAGESEGDFRVRLRQLAVEARDLEMEKLRAKYAAKIASLEGKLRTAEERVDREKAQSRESMIGSAVSIGTTLIGAMFGRKLASRTNVSKAGTAFRSIGRAATQHSDIARAEQKKEDVQQEIDELEKEFAASLEQVKAQFQPESLELEELSVTPRKSDITVSDVALAWAPWIVDSADMGQPAYMLG
ncbi:MAG: hypothetical protein KDA41_13355, partial [Planctomycetales bacterium]|nr:hypothetical protein [Planctomycetales bacterium]